MRASDFQSVHTIVTEDHESLETHIYSPPNGSSKAVVICAHAMMADLKTFEKSGFAQHLVNNQYSVVLFNFRGRGDSTLPDWSYDDLVHLDVPAVMDYVTALFPKDPLFWLGHSLGGHVALAAYGGGHLDKLAGFALISTNVWLPRLEDNRWRQFKKHAGMGAARLYLKCFRTLPIKATGFGTADEAPTYLKDLIRWWFEDRWSSANGTVDYLRAIHGLKTPIISVVGESDRLEAHPEAALAFLNAFEPKHSTFLVADAKWTDGRSTCNHMNLITSTHSAPGWTTLCNWFQGVLEDNERTRPYADSGT